MCQNNIWCESFLSQPYGRLKAAIDTDYFAFQITQPAVDIQTAVAVHSGRYHIHTMPPGGGFNLGSQRNNLIATRRTVPQRNALQERGLGVFIVVGNFSESTIF